MSMHSEVDRFLDRVRVRTPGHTDAEIKEQFYQVAHEFFTDTSFWTHTLAFQTISGVQNYQLSAFPQGIPIRLVTVIDQNNIPWGATMPLGISLTPNVNPATTNTVPALPGNVQLLNAPTSSLTLLATFIMTVALPTDGTDLPEMPDWVLPWWSTVFQDGVIGYMLTTPKKPYTDLTTGNYFLKKYRDGISRARVATLRMQTQGTQRWVFPQDFRSYGQKGGVSVGNAYTF